MFGLDWCKTLSYSQQRLYAKRWNFGRIMGLTTYEMAQALQTNPNENTIKEQKMMKTCNTCGQDLPEPKFKKGDKVSVPARGIKLGIVRYVVGRNQNVLSVTDFTSGESVLCDQNQIGMKIVHGYVRVLEPLKVSEPATSF